VYPAVLLKILIFFDVSRFLSIFPGIQILLPYKRKGTASTLCTFILENFWVKFGSKAFFRIPSIGTNFTCCKHLLSTAVSYLTGPCPKNSIVSEFPLDYYHSKIFSCVF